MAVGALAVPLASATDLKHRQEQVQGQIKSAGHDLEDSSRRLQRAAARLASVRAELADAREELAAALAKLGAAQIRDREMQARLETAIVRLVDAQTDLATGQQALADQRVQVTSTITTIYEEGDPELLAFASLLDAQTPADLATRMEARNVIVGRETRAYDDLHAAEVLLEVRENEVQAAKDDVAVQRRAAAEHLVTMQQLVAGDPGRQGQGPSALRPRPPGPSGRGPGPAARPRRPGPPAPARERDQGADPRAGPPGRPALQQRLPAATPAAS